MTQKHPWRRPPGRASLEWAEASLGRGFRLGSVRALRRGGGWHVNHILELESPRGTLVKVVLRRWAHPALRHDPDCTAAREAEVLRRLETTSIPAPRVLALDADAEHCDVPALLVSLLPGGPPGPAPPVAPMAELLARIHEVDPSGTPPFRRYYPVPRRPGPWLPRSNTWARVFELANEPLPPGEPTFIHRDYHPGNTLWLGGRISGIVDWAQTSLAPASADLGHMRWNLAAARGPGVADRFEAAYRAVTGRDHDPRWDLVSLVDVLPELEGIGARRLERLTRYAGSVLARI
jgi:aminoglycoside phosphotransferase (APT) family kinase protein